jgi:ectoine hydroxylase
MLTTQGQRQSFNENGYIVIPGLFSVAEIDRLNSDMIELETESLVADAQGRNKGGMVVEDSDTPRLQFDIHRSGTGFDLLSRHPRMAGIVQEVLGMPVYVYHSKLAFKAAFMGSVQFWHQDFGYWIGAKHPNPTMASCLLMLDRHTEDNGCMQVLSGSHREGVVPHDPCPRESTGDGQLRIPATAMSGFVQKYERVKFTGEPGDFAVWHCNAMHASAHNISEHSRHAAIMAYNAVGNYDPANPIGADSPWGAECDNPIELCDDGALAET